MPEYRRNYERNKIELYFESKPSELLRESLKLSGWRWNREDAYWYHYYSEANLQVAKDICAISGDNELLKNTTESSVKKIETVKNVTHKTISEIDRLREKFETGKRFIVEKENKYYSVISEGLIDSKTFRASYIDYNKGDNICSSFSIESVKSGFTPYTYIKGNRVEYIAKDNTLIHGAILKSDKENGTYDILSYYFDNSGKLIKIEEKGVLFERVISRYYDDIIPLKEGDRVYFFSDQYEYTTGTVRHVAGNKVRVRYSYYTYDFEDNQIEESDEQSIPIDEIRLVRCGKEPIPRNFYINEYHEELINQNELIKTRIKNRKDIFKEAKKFISNNSLYRHQKAGAMLANKYNKFAFFYDTGTGKTVMALDVISTKEKKENARFLIIAPKAIIKTAWMDDAAKYYPDLRILPLYNGFNIKKKKALLQQWHSQSEISDWEDDPLFKIHAQLIFDLFKIGEISNSDEKRIVSKLESEARHYIINSEMFIRNPDKYIRELGINGIIMDESAILKNYEGKTASEMRRVCRHLRYVYLLSGKPAPNNTIEYFSQMKIVDPDTFSMTYEDFLDTFCYTSNRKYYMIPENEKLFAELVSLKSLIISKKDCLDLPDTIDVVRLIELPKSVMDDYNSLYTECLAIIKGMDNSRNYYSTESRLSILMKLRQMASGFFIINNGNSREEKVIVDIHNAKIAELNTILDDIEDEQVIIWCQFQYEIEMLEKELSKRATTVTAYGKTKDIEESISAFKTGKAKYIIAHPKTLKYGVTFTNCKYTVYYSFSYSAEDYDQSHDRNYRLGQTKKCTYIYLQAADTIDEIMYAKVMHKLSDAEFFERLIKDATTHGIDYDSLKQKSDDEIRDALFTKNGVVNNVIDKMTNVQVVDKKSKLTEDILEREFYTTLDYLDRLEEPSLSEISSMDNYLLDDEINDDRFLFDVSRPDYYDFIKPYEDPVKYDIDMTTEEFYALLYSVPYEERWVYNMYRVIKCSLDTLKPSYRDIIIKRYGLKTGKKNSFTSIAKYMREKYPPRGDFKWTAKTVEQYYNYALSELMRSCFLEIAPYAEKVVDNIEYNGVNRDYFKKLLEQEKCCYKVNGKS